MNGVMKDVSYALRSARHAAGLSGLVVATLALGIAASTVMFTVVDAVLLRPLPFAAPHELVWMETFSRENGGRGSSNLMDFEDWRARSRSFSGMAAYWDETYTIGLEEPERVEGASVSPEYFEVLGVKPLYGRGFTPSESTFGRHRVVVLRHEFWMRVFGGDPGAIGRTLYLNGSEFTVIGVMPPGWPGAWSRVQVWRAMSFPPGDWRIADRGSRWMQGAIGRVRSGVPVERAHAELDAISAALEREYLETNDGRGVRALPLREFWTQESGTALRVLLGAVAVLVLIACVNVASMLLARATTRQREVAVRRALGASPVRLVRLFLIESLVLALMGGAAGLLLTRMLLPLATRLSGEQITGLGSPALDLRVLTFALLVSLTTALLFGMAPALHSTRGALGGALNAGRAVVAGRGTPRALRSLLVLEVALAVILLMGSGLLLESFRRQNAVDPGYAPENVLTLRAAVLARMYPDGPAIISFWDRVITQLEAVPGVEAVATTMFDMPIRGSGWVTFFGVHGRPVPAARNEWRDARFALVGGDYFRALDLQVLRGRALEPQDNRPAAERVVVINESLARTFFPDEDPIRTRVWLFGPGDMDATIVGIVEDMRLSATTADPEPTVYVPTVQTTHGLPATQWILLRTTGDPVSMVAAVRSAIHAVDRAVAIDRVESLDRVVRTSFAPQRFRTLVLGAFAAVALIVAGVGLYGVVAYVVSRERRDIGIRMALGAGKAHAVGHVFRQVISAVSLGLAFGLAAALLLARFFSSLLFGVPAANPATLLTVTAALVLTAAVACLGPASNAAAIAPTEAMRAN